MKPPPLKLAGDRTVFRALELQQTGTVPAGRVMFCRGRKVLGYADVARLGNIFEIPKGADTICVSAADLQDVKEWIATSSSTEGYNGR
jgi:hypothetical protein